jgi:hypothetical protein
MESIICKRILLPNKKLAGWNSEISELRKAKRERQGQVTIGHLRSYGRRVSGRAHIVRPFNLIKGGLCANAPKARQWENALAHPKCAKHFP